MTDDKSWLTSSPEETERVGESLAKKLRGGELILLVGELGSGKTTFVRGLARGLGVDDPGGVASPSFKIVSEHPGPLRLHHVDLYRLDDPVAIEELAIDELIAPDAVVIVEWGEKLPIPFAPAIEVEFRTHNGGTRGISIRSETSADQDSDGR